MSRFTTFRGVLDGDNTIDAIVRRTYDLPANADAATVKKATDAFTRANPVLAGPVQPNLAGIKPGTIFTVPTIADVPIRVRPGGVGGIGGIGGIPGFPSPGTPPPGPAAAATSPALEPVITRVARAAQILDADAGRRELGLAGAKLATKRELEVVQSDDLKPVREQPTLKQRFATIAGELVKRGERIEADAKETKESVKTLRDEVKKLTAAFGDGGLPV